MARTDDDTWDINESVGATALGVAGGRAAETSSADPLINDPYARLFLEAAGDGIWRMFLDDEPPPELTDIDPRFKERMQVSMSYMGSRTKFFDEFFVAAASNGIHQAVILAAGLDARAWRLAWPEESVVYEIDQPKVLSFKLETLAAHDATAVATHVGVGIDLRQQWPKALVDAGFDPAVPTAWLAEGLLPYLTAEAQELLFERIQSLSAPGSRIAVEAFTNDFFSVESFTRRQDQMQQYRDIAIKFGGRDITESGNLLYEEERTAVTDWLVAHGWNVVAAISAEDLLASNNRVCTKISKMPFPTAYSSKAGSRRLKTHPLRSVHPEISEAEAQANPSLQCAKSVGACSSCHADGCAAQHADALIGDQVLAEAFV